MQYSKTPLVAVVIVTYNGVKWTELCMSSLYKDVSNPYVIVIDNGSTDGTIQKIKADFKDVHLVETGKNLGFGAANNMGIKVAVDKGADYVFLLNQDAYIYKGAISSAMHILDNNSDIGIVSPMHFAGDGINLDNWFYNYINPLTTPALMGNLISKTNIAPYYQTEFVNAAAWILRAQVFKQFGGFHPLFAHYGEDSEFIVRLKKNGLKVCIDPNLAIIHDRPQIRHNNALFTRNASLKRNLLLKYFKEGKVSGATIFKNYLKLFFIYLFNFKIKDAFLTFKYGFETGALVKQAKTIKVSGI